MLKVKTIFPRAFGFFFHATLSLMLIDWAVPELFWKGLISPYEISFLLMGFAFLGCFCLNGKKMIRQVIQTLAACKWQVLCLCGYLLMGVITLFYAQSVTYAVSKYIVVVQMLTFGVCGFVYVADKREAGKDALQEMYANMGISAVVSALLGYYGFFSGTKTIYLDRISPNPDYNQYTTILLIGLVCGVFWALNLKLRKHFQYLVVGALCCVLVPAIYIAGSRRSYLLMLVVVSLLIAYLVISEIVRYITNNNCRQFGAGTGSLILCAICVALSMNILDGEVKNVADIRMQQILGVESVPTPTTEGDNSDVTVPTEGESPDVTVPTEGEGPDVTVPTEGESPDVTVPTEGEGPDVTVPTEGEGPDVTVPTEGESSNETVPNVIIPGSDLTETYETIVSGTALNKRMMIWGAAWDKIISSDPTRLVIGYGASYSSDLYDDLTNPKVQQVYSAYGYNENNKAREHWMNTHNLFLQDMLEGGIILLTIQLLLILMAAVNTIKLLLREPLHGATLGILYGILLVTLFLSSDRGMISNKFFWLIMTLQILGWSAMPRKVRK